MRPKEGGSRPHYPSFDPPYLTNISVCSVSLVALDRYETKLLHIQRSTGTGIISNPNDAEETKEPMENPPSRESSSRLLAAAFDSKSLCGSRFSGGRS